MHGTTTAAPDDLAGALGEQQPDDRLPGGTKASWDPAVADQLLAKIDEVAEIFWETKKAA